MAALSYTASTFLSREKLIGYKEAVKITRLRELRLKAGLTQKDVAARLGVDQVAVSHWELGKHHPREQKVQALAKLYGCSTADILNAAEEYRRREDGRGREALEAKIEARGNGNEI